MCSDRRGRARNAGGSTLLHLDWRSGETGLMQLVRRSRSSGEGGALRVARLLTDDPSSIGVSFAFLFSGWRAVGGFPHPVDNLCGERGNAERRGLEGAFVSKEPGEGNPCREQWTLSTSGARPSRTHASARRAASISASLYIFIRSRFTHGSYGNNKSFLR